MNKKIIVVISFLVVIVLAILLIFSNNTKNEIKDNDDDRKKLTSEKLIKEQIVDGIKISNIKMTVTDGVTSYTATITNTTTKDKTIDSIIMTVKDNSGKEIAKLTGYVGATMKPNEKKEIINSTDIDLSNAETIDYNIK